MFCQKCGAELPDDAIFCSKCGTNQQNFKQPDEIRAEVRKGRKDDIAVFQKKNRNHAQGAAIKKRNLIIAIIAFLVLILLMVIAFVIKERIKTESSEESSKNESVLQSDDDLSEAFEDDEIEEDYISNKNEDVHESDEDKKNKYDGGIKLCNRSKEWEDLTLDDMAIQICDTVLYPGCSLGDAMDKLAESEYYDYMRNDYNPERLITSKSFVTATLKITTDKGEKAECYLKAFNYSDETIAMKELVLEQIDIPQDIYPYCRFIDGRSYDEIMKMTYQDVRNMTCLAGFSMREEGSLSIIYQSGVLPSIPVKRAQWTYYDYMGKSEYIFGINPDTFSVEKFEAISYINSNEKSKGEEVTSLSVLTDNDIRDLVEVGKKTFISDHPDETVTFKEVSDTIYLSKFTETDIDILINYVNADNEEKIACIQIASPGVLFDGTITYRIIYTQTASNMDEAYENVTWAAQILDERNIGNKQ